MILVSEPAAVKIDVRAVEAILMTLVVCLAHPELMCTFSASAQTEDDVSRFKNCPDKIVRDTPLWTRSSAWRRLCRAPFRRLG